MTNKNVTNSEINTLAEACNADRQELQSNELAADMIQNIINSRSQVSKGEIELGAHYSMSEEAMRNIQVLANLATEGKVQRM